jgi:hypothetical protein
VAEGSRDLDKLGHIARPIYYNRDLEKEKKNLEREKKKDKWQKALITVLRKTHLGQSTNTRTCFQYGQAGHFRRVSREEAISRTLPHLSWKSLEDTLSSVPRGSYTRASDPMMGPRVSHPGSCNHQKKQRSSGQYLLWKSTSQPPY